jgi:hypothetical protein
MRGKSVFLIGDEEDFRRLHLKVRSSMTPGPCHPTAQNVQRFTQSASSPMVEMSSSANFTEAAQERNIEIGLLLHSTAIAGRLTRFFDALCASGQFQRALRAGSTAN